MLKHMIAFMMMALFGAAFSSDLMAKEQKSFVLSLPIIALDGQGVARGEYNFSGHALAVEMDLISKENDFSTQEMKEQHDDTLAVRGAEAAVWYTSYGDPRTMSGGYWSVGAGYRRMVADWKRTPGENMAIAADAVRDENNRVTHALTSEGATLHGRVGYRWVPASFPLALGAYIGARHFQNKFKDRSSETNTTATPLSDQEALSRRFMSALEPGLEIGMAF